MLDVTVVYCNGLYHVHLLIASHINFTILYYITFYSMVTWITAVYCKILPFISEYLFTLCDTV